MKELEDKLASYLRARLGAPDLTIANLARIPGGASRETYRFRARYKASFSKSKGSTQEFTLA